MGSYQIARSFILRTPPLPMTNRLSENLWLVTYQENPQKPETATRPLLFKAFGKLVMMLPELAEFNIHEYALWMKRKMASIERPKFAIVYRGVLK